MSGDNGNVLVELRPFKHQVGGHTCVLELNKSTICKPHVDREAWFYLNAPERFKEFTPKYRGEIEVTCDVSGGSMCLIASLPQAVVVDQGLVEFTPPVSFNSPQSHVGVRPCQKHKRGDRNESGDPLDTPEQTAHSNSSSLEPGAELWSTQCIKRQINRHGFWANNKPQKFIMLENLVHDYRRPCLLDLKMGRRQYGDDSSDEKKKMLEIRCRQSTSGSLGIRICGTQVFQEQSKSYITHDKYHGRQLNAVGVKQELLHFFHNGVNMRKDAVIAIITKLQKLKVFLETQSDFKLYSCSLLVMYDGFINTNNSSSNPSKGCNSCTNNTLYTSEKTTSSDSSAVTHGDTTGMCSTCVQPRVDVRLIDFAHASSGNNQNEERDVHLQSPPTGQADTDFPVGMDSDIDDRHVNTTIPQDTTTHNCSSNGAIGANEGIIFGLDNLIAVLQSLL